MGEEAAGSVLNEVGHEFETFLPPVVGIGHCTLRVSLTKIGEVSDFGLFLRRAGKGEDIPAILTVHGEDQVVTGKVLPGESSRRAGHRVTSLGQGA